MDQLVSLDGAGHNNVECDFMPSLLGSLQDFFVHLESQRREDEQESDTEYQSKARKDDSDSDDDEAEPDS